MAHRQPALVGVNVVHTRCCACSTLTSPTHPAIGPAIEEMATYTAYQLASNSPRMSSGPRLPEKLPSSSLSTASNN